MSERDDYPPGVPCWVETLQPSPRRAMAFYGQVFRWQFSSSPTAGQAEPDYVVARRNGGDVAGICWLPPQARTRCGSPLRPASRTVAPP